MRIPGLTQQLIFATATGRFYLEWRGVAPGFYGLGAPPLLAQPDADGRTLWEVGFEQVPVNLQVTNTVAATGVWTVPDHRLIPGDAVTLSGMPGGHTPPNGNYFAYPLNESYNCNCSTRRPTPCWRPTAARRGWKW